MNNPENTRFYDADSHQYSYLNPFWYSERRPNSCTQILERRRGGGPEQRTGQAGTLPVQSLMCTLFLG